METQKTFDEVGGYFPDRLKISFAGACVRQGSSGAGEMRGFFEDKLKDLFTIMEKADVIIGFNVDNFDLQALAPYYGGDITLLPTLDILTKIKDSAGHRISLDAVAQETLGIGKTGDGLDAIK